MPSFHRSSSSGPRSPTAKRSSGLSPPTTPRSPRTTSRPRRITALHLLAFLVLLVGMAQLWGAGPRVRHALLSRCSPAQYETTTYSTTTGHVGLWEQLCAREALRLSKATSTGLQSLTEGAEHRYSGAGDHDGSSSGGSGRASSSQVDSTAGIDGGGGVPTVKVKGNRAESETVSAAANAEVVLAAAAAAAAVVAKTSTSAGVDDTSPLSYHPAEWPNVYGGQAEPHKRILKRCSGSIFAPAPPPGARPAEGLVAVWLPTRFDLAFCDRNGQSAQLAMRPAASSSSAAGEGRKVEPGKRSTGPGQGSAAATSEYGGGRGSGGRGSGAEERSRTSPAVGASVGAWLRRLLPDSTGAARVAAGGADQNVAGQSQTVDLATSRALMADGGSIRIAWYDSRTLLADGVASSLRKGIPCPGEPRALCTTVGGQDDEPGDDLYDSGSDSSGGRWRRLGLLIRRWWRARLRGSDATAAERAGRQGPDGTTVAAAPMLVLAAREDRLVLAVLAEGEDVRSAAAAAFSLAASPNIFTQRLEAAVMSAYEALRTVPYAVGLPPHAPAEDKRLSRKLYDIMLVNTGVGWSTPDRSPHGWQWLWDSCFHAMGMNLVNHTTAWEQLQGLLLCQQPDGFVPHMCGGGPPSRLTQPPLLAWAVWDNFLFARNKSRLEWALPRIERLLHWLAAHRSRDGGLTYSYLHAFESGMDNSPRFDTSASSWGLAGVAAGWLTGLVGGRGADGGSGSVAAAATLGDAGNAGGSGGGGGGGGGGGSESTGAAAATTFAAAGVSSGTGADTPGGGLGRRGGADGGGVDPRVGGSRSGCAVCSPHALSMDLCALVAREMALVARMHEALGDTQAADMWLSRSRNVTAALTARAWHPQRRMYGDVVYSLYDSALHSIGFGSPYHAAAPNSSAAADPHPPSATSTARGRGGGSGDSSLRGQPARWSSWVKGGAAGAASQGSSSSGGGGGEGGRVNGLGQAGRRLMRQQQQRRPPGGRPPGQVVSGLVTAAGLLPLLAGPLPREHLRGLLEKLKDPEFFGTPVPLPSVAVADQRRRGSRRRRSLAPSSATATAFVSGGTRTLLSGSSSAPGSGTARDGGDVAPPQQPSSLPQDSALHQPYELHYGQESPSSYSSSWDMWQGPMWVNVNYLVAVGLREQQWYCNRQQRPRHGRRSRPRARMQESRECEECGRLAEWIERSTIAEIRRWYGGSCAATAATASNHTNQTTSLPGPTPGLGPGASFSDPSGPSTSSSSSSSFLGPSGPRGSPRGPSRAAQAGLCTGTVFEYYDSDGLVPPTRLSRKGAGGVGGVRDYHWTAALTLRLMAESAARAAAGAEAVGGGWSGAGWGQGTRVPAWVPGEHALWRGE